LSDSTLEFVVNEVVKSRERDVAQLLDRRDEVFVVTIVLGLELLELGSRVVFLDTESSKSPDVLVLAEREV
jgi:hypothetical protein